HMRMVMILTAAAVVASLAAFGQNWPVEAQEAQAAQQAAQAKDMERQAQRAADRAIEIKARVDARGWDKGDESEVYRRAGRQLDERQYEKALDSYNRVIEAKGAHIEGALYWKAYALSRLGHGDQAQAALDELKRNYASSRWMNDARALELEIRQNAGQKPSPEVEGDEDLKLLAMNGLIGTDPERVMPQIDKILSSAKSSPRLKERALFVLAQSSNAKAREMLLKYAKGGTNPDLQLKAVEYLAAHGVKEDRAQLDEIYKANSDFGIRRAILRGYMASHETDALLQIARNEQNPALRGEAIRYAGISGADVWPLYSASAPPEVRRAIIETLFIKRDVDHLAEIARSEKDMHMRSDAIRHIGNLSREKAGELLGSLYASETDKEVKADILRSLAQQQNAKKLIEVARKETDPNLKREAVRQLTMIKTPEAQEFLVELLNK
ncbi:MAG TPA: HEAT repeat domain-containing protein, partial [Bryobacteraceae bacterium]